MELTPRQKNVALGLAAIGGLGLLYWFIQKAKVVEEEVYAEPEVIAEEALVCTPNEEEVLENCPDGSVKKKRVCNSDGLSWLEITYDCPLLPCECTEWIPNVCIGVDLRAETRVCSYPPGCNVEYREVYDPSCKTLKLHVMDANRNISLSGASVSVNGSPVCITDENGYCGMAAEYGKVELCVTKAGYTNVMVGLGDCFITDVYPPTTSMTVWLKSIIEYKCWVKGYIKSAGSLGEEYGTPISGATVSVNGYSMITGTDGYYEIGGLPCGTLLTITVSAPGYITSSETFWDSYSKDRYLNVETEPAQLIIYAGEFVDASTMALEGVRIVIDGVEYPYTTDVNGYCKPFPIVEPGVHTVNVSKTGYITKTICTKDGCWDMQSLSLTANGGINYSITFKMVKT